MLTECLTCRQGEREDSVKHYYNLLYTHSRSTVGKNCSSFNLVTKNLPSIGVYMCVHMCTCIYWMGIFAFLRGTLASSASYEMATILWERTRRESTMTLKSWRWVMDEQTEKETDRETERGTDWHRNRPRETDRQCLDVDTWQTTPILPALYEC